VSTVATSPNRTPQFVRISLGAAPTLALIASAGLLIVALANNAAIRGHAVGQPLFLVGLLTIFLPIAFRLLGAKAERSERLATVLVLGMALYLVKVLHSPIEFTRFDELAWWRATDDIITGGHAFVGNSLNAATAGYPFLPTLTAAISQLTGLSIFWSGLMVIGLTRAVFMVALFLFLETTVDSSRGAGIGVLIYACNSSFLYFDSQFAYESLGLTMAAVFLLASLRWSQFDYLGSKRETGGLVALLLLLAGGLVITHHLTSFFVLVFLLIWTAIRLGFFRSGKLVVGEWHLRGPIVPFSIVAVLVTAWLILVAGHATVAELGSVFSSSYHSLSDLIRGTSSTKRLFSGSGERLSAGERGLILMSVLLTALLIAAGVIRVWSNRTGKPLWWALSIIAILDPLALGLRLTPASTDIAARAQAFCFLGIAFLAALLFARGVGKWQRPQWALVISRTVIAVLAAVAFAGGVIFGELKVTRQPGPYLVGAEDRSITAEGLAAARFAASHLPEDAQVLTDRTNATLLGSYGQLKPVFGNYVATPLPQVLLGPYFGEESREALRGRSVSYVVVDRRLSRELPSVGYYVELNEPSAGIRKRPVNVKWLEKLAELPGIDRIYTNGPISVYDTARLLGDGSG
jgi:hypothetical protein